MTVADKLVVNWQIKVLSTILFLVSCKFQYNLGYVRIHKFSKTLTLSETYILEMCGP